MLASYTSAKVALKWSQSLANAALDFVNQKGVLGSAAKASMFLTAHSRYAYTVCGTDRLEFEVTHSINT